jgi:hypothetical protein
MNATKNTPIVEKEETKCHPWSESSFWDCKSYEYDPLKLQFDDAMQQTLNDQQLASLLSTRSGRAQLRGALRDEACLTDASLYSAIQTCLNMHNRKQSAFVRGQRRRIKRKIDECEEPTSATIETPDPPPYKKKKESDHSAQDMAIAAAMGFPLQAPKLEREMTCSQMED